MSVTRKELLRRRQAFHQIVRELGLAPPPTSPNASSYKIKALDVSDIPAIAALKHPQDSSSSTKWIIAPATIITTDTEKEVTASSIIVDFLESAQSTTSLANQIDQFAEDPSGARKIAVIVGKCADKFEKTKTCEEKFSTIFTANSQKKIYATAQANSRTGTSKPSTAAARKGVIDCLKQSDKFPINEPTIIGAKGNRANCAVHTIFVHAATQHEGMGGPDSSLFLNYIPNFILSRAFPVLNVIIDLPDGLDQRKVIQSLGPSLILGDAIGLKGSDTAKIDGIFTKAIDPTTGVSRAPGRGIGNDTFNTPQTLGYSRSRHGTLLNEPDPSPANQFAPIACIDSFSMNFDAGDLSSLQTREAVKGDLVLKFPDKTKLTGLDQMLIGTNDLLSMTIELGWSIEPNQTILDDEGKKNFLGSQDPILQYINSQRIRLNCTTTLGGMQFDESGAIQVTLKLTDPANYDKVEGPNISDIPDFIKVFNKTDPRFIKFVTTVLNKEGTKSSGAGTDDIAINTGYAKTVSKIFKPSKKKTTNKRELKQIDKYNKKQDAIHYKIDDLAEMAKDSKGWKDGDLIMQHVDAIKNTNPEETKGYEYHVFSLKQGGAWAEFITEFVAEVKEAKQKPKMRYSKKTDAHIAHIESALTEEFLYFTPPDGRKVPSTQRYGQFLAAWNALIKEHTTRHKRLQTPEMLSKLPLFDDKNFNGLNDLSLLSTGQFPGKEHIKSDAWTSIPMHPQTGEPLPHSAVYGYVGKVKLDYPKTLVPPMTVAQQKKRKKAQSSLTKSLTTLKSSDLKEARNELSFWTYAFILSSGFVLQTNTKAKSSSRIVNNVRDGKDMSSKAFEMTPKDTPGGKLLSWWYSSTDASKFIPFSHLVHHTLVQPLYATGQFDEIQILYFKFNNQCGNMSGANIGDCPISQTLNNQLDKYDSGFGFINYVMNTQINEIKKNKTPFKFESIDVSKGKKKVKIIAPNQTVPKVEFLTRVITEKSEDNPKVTRKILRISFMDRFCSEDEDAGQRIMNSMRDDGRTTALNAVQTTNQAATESIRKKMFIKALEESGAIKKSDSLLGESVIQTGPKTFRIIKSAIKASHPHLNYGAMGSALLRCSISTQLSGREQMMVQTKAMKAKERQSSTGRFKASQAGKSTEIGITEVVGAARNVSIEMVGCPMLQCGTLYFIDFYTETDIDNFYICKKVSHKLSNNTFTTQAEFHLWDSGGRHTVPGDIDGFEAMIGNTDAKD